MPACASAASWNAVKSLWPSQRLLRRGDRGEVDPVEQPRPAVAAAHGDRAARRRGSAAMRMTAARRSSSVAEKRCQRADAVGSTMTRWPSASSRSAARARSLRARSQSRRARRSRCRRSAPSSARVLPPRREEIRQQRAAGFRRDAAGHRRVMIEPRLGEEIDDRCRTRRSSDRARRTPAGECARA